MKTLIKSIFGLLAMVAMTAFAEDFTLKSQSISEGEKLSKAHVFSGFGCEGGNQSPHLIWENPPAGTKSFVITAYDPDAPTGSGWWHWVVFNIPTNATHLEANASAAGKIPTGAIQARNDYGQNLFGGACPPPGAMHRYEFTVFALDVAKLDLDATASPALIGFMTRAHAIASAKITAVYTR